MACLLFLNVTGASRSSLAETLAPLPVLVNPAVHVADTSHTFLTASAVSGDRIIIAGEHGYIATSDDRGQTWAQASVPVQVQLTALAFNGTEGWALGHAGVVLHSVDRGATWHLLLDGVAASRMFEDSVERATDLQPDQRESLLKASRRLADAQPAQPFLAIDAHDPDHVLIVGAAGLAVETTDHGHSFAPIELTVPDPISYHLYGIANQGPVDVIVGEAGLLLHRNSLTASFQKVDATQDASLFGVVASKTAFIAFGVVGTICRSVDGGVTWMTLPNNPQGSGLNAGVVLDNGVIVLGNSAGELLVSRDDGKSFQKALWKTLMPITSVTELNDGSVFVTGAAGSVRVAKSKLAAST